jgi:hypothetical protein
MRQWSNTLESLDPSFAPGQVLISKDEFPRQCRSMAFGRLVMVIGGKRFFLWRAVDSEGEVLDLLVQRRRDKTAAVTFLHKLLKKQGYAPDVMVTDKLRSYGAAKAQIGISARDEQALAQEQPLRKLASAHPAAGGQDAAFQVTRIGPALPCRSCRGLQHLQPSASSHLPLYAPPLQGELDGAMAGSNSGRVKTVRQPAPVRLKAASRDNPGSAHAPDMRNFSLARAQRKSSAKCSSLPSYPRCSPLA